MSSNGFPKPSGKYKVGTKVETLIDESRVEMLGPDKGKEKRKITYRIYYPVSPDSVDGLKKGELISREVAEGLKRQFHIGINYDKKVELGLNNSECYIDAPHIINEKFPLLIFSHGLLSYKEGNSFLLTEIASQGYVVISIGHTYASAAETHADGTITYGDKNCSKNSVQPFLSGFIALMRFRKFKGTPEEEYKKFTELQNKYCRFNVDMVKEWSKDTEFVLEYAKKSYSDFIDFTPGVALSGHSLGGATAYYLCQTNNDFACGINIDGGLFGDYDNMIMNKPFCFLCNEGNYNVASRVKFSKTADSYYVTFKDIKHIAFSDIKYFMPMSFVTGKIPADISHEYQCRCHVDFLDKYLKGKDLEIKMSESKYIRFEKY